MHTQVAVALEQLKRPNYILTSVLTTRYTFMGLLMVTIEAPEHVYSLRKTSGGLTESTGVNFCRFADSGGVIP